MKRREFLKTAAATGSMVTAKSLEVMAQKFEANLEILVLNTNWGFEGDIDTFCKKTKAEGFDGIEVWWSNNMDINKALFDALQKHELEVGFLTTGEGAEPAHHISTYKKNVEAILGTQSQKPLYINSHSGKDFFSFKDNGQLVEFSIEKTAQYGIEVLHETHRSRMCFAAHITKGFLDEFEEMKLTLDISHWVNVHESMLDTLEAIVEKALQRTWHIHARVGHPEGPQVNDPRAPEWKAVLEKHLAWWDKAIKYREQSGAKRMTFLTEFGPPSYLPTLPYTQQPVADQWAINVFMKDLIKERYS